MPYFGRMRRTRRCDRLKSTQHDQKEVSWDAQSPYRTDRIPRRDRPRGRARPRLAADDWRDRQAGERAEGGNAADERRDERHEFRHDGLRLTGDAEADHSARAEGLPRVVRRPDDGRHDAAASQAGAEAVDPRSGRRCPPDDGTRRPDAPADGRADDDEPRDDGRVHEEGRLPARHQDGRDGGRRDEREDRRPRQQLAAGGDGRLTRRRRLLGLLGAGAVLATLAAAPALSQTSTPIQTLYIAKPGQTLPQTGYAERNFLKQGGRSSR